MSKKDRNFLLPAIVVILAIIIFIVGYQVLMPSIVENSAKVIAYNSDIQLAQEKIDSISVAKSTMSKFSDVVNNLLIAVPDSVDAPDLITEIEVIAGQNQVALPSISPPTDINSSKSSGTSGLTVNIAIAGGFQNISNFVNSLETSIRFSKISSLTISTSQEGALAATISFDVYKRPAVEANGLSQEEEANNE